MFLIKCFLYKKNPVYDDIYQFRKMVRSQNNVKEKLPLSDLVEIQFRKGSQAIYVK